MYFRNTHLCDKKGGKPFRDLATHNESSAPEHGDLHSLRVPELSVQQSTRILIYQDFWRTSEIQLNQKQFGQEVALYFSGTYKK